MPFLADPFRLLWKYRKMLEQTTWNEIKTRYAGSLLGLAWLVVYPLLFLGAYCIYIFAMVETRLGIHEMQTAIDRVLLIFCGLIPFFGFSEALSSGTSSVTTNASLIKNTLFPIELIPVKAVFVAQCTQVVGTGILLVALGGFGKLTLWALFLPAVWALQILFSIGVAWIVSSMNVYFRDLQNIMSVLILMLMLVSPIAYKGSDIPRQIMPLMRANPLYYMILCYQDCLLYGRFPQVGLLSTMGALTAAFFFTGYWFFRRMKLVFADNV